MVNQNQFAGSLPKRMLIGWLIGLAVISFFVFGADCVKPEWGEFWRIRPLIITPLATAVGGACFYFIDRFGSQHGWPKAIIYSISFTVFFVGMWMGTVIGLAGTMWN